jgi:hypothetical protein
MVERGWAGRLLVWWPVGRGLLAAEVAFGRYYIRGERHEVVAWGEAAGRGWGLPVCGGGAGCLRAGRPTAVPAG